jgi:hypothetical protein
LASGDASAIAGRHLEADAGTVQSRGPGRAPDVRVEWRDGADNLIATVRLPQTTEGGSSLASDLRRAADEAATKAITKAPIGLVPSPAAGTAAKFFADNLLPPNRDLVPQLMMAQRELGVARATGDTAKVEAARAAVVALARACLPKDICVAQHRAAKIATAYWLHRWARERGLRFK